MVHPSLWPPLPSPLNTLSPGWVSLPQGRIFHVVGGGGPPVILLHGFGGQCGVWVHQVSILLQQGFRVHLLDLPGYGHSDRPRQAYTPRFFLESLEAYLVHERLHPPILMGHSLGGSIALAWALKYASRCRALILVSPYVPGAIPAHPLLRLALGATRIPGFCPLYLALPATWTLRWALRWMMADPQRATPAMVAYLAAFRKRPGSRWAWCSTARHLRDWHTLSFKPATLPALIVWGEKDRYLSPKEGRRLCTWLPRARLEVLPDAGHIAMWEQPTRFNALLRSFLETLGPDKREVH